MQTKHGGGGLRRTVLVTAIVGLATAASARASLAQPLLINNPGFESFPLAGPGIFSTHIGIGLGSQVLSGNPIPGWVLVGHGGSFRPGSASFPSGAPEGLNVAWLEYESIHSSSLSQVLADVLNSNTVYTLSVKVGRRLDYPLAPFTVQLLAGGEVLGQDTLATIPAGQFETVTVTFATPADHPLLGLPLAIRLTADNANQQQVVFDDVKLDASMPF